MSRFIMTNNHPENTHKITDSKKLILTHLSGKKFAFLMQGNKLMQVSALDDKASKVGDIYIGKIKKIVKNIDACFVEIDEGELVYLPLSHFKNVFLTNRLYDGRILEGDEILLQITRDALKTKQAAATTNITQNGKYFIFDLETERIGISNKIGKEQQNRLTDLLKKQNMLPNHGGIVRTEAANLSDQEFQDTFLAEYQNFCSIFNRAVHSKCFKCIKQAARSWELLIKQITDHDYQEIVTDIPAIEQEIKNNTSGNISIRLYEDKTYPLRKLYGLESKLQEALSRRVWLKSGAYLIVDTTEALVVFDVNSGKFEGKKPSGEAFFKINMEAAEEIARQIKLRNYSGIILIDFINMEKQEYVNALLEHMRILVKSDPIRTTVVDITPLGIMEITRKKVNKPLHDLMGKG